MNVASTDNTVDVAWPAANADGGATDGLSGVDGYSWFFSQGPTDVPDQVKENEAGGLTAASPTLAPGSRSTNW